MMSSLITSRWLHEHLGESNLIVADVRWDGMSPGSGRAAFECGHIPGAIYFDLDDDLSDRSDLTRGRHPLPDPSVFVETLRRKGLDPASRIVACDDAGGSIAARLWWMMRWIGHDVVSLLDGGIAAWWKEGYPAETGATRSREPALQRFQPHVHSEEIATRAEVETAKASGSVLVDARAPERFRGEAETIDFKAGHIPDAINIFWQNNLTEDGLQVFRSPHALRALYEQHGVRADSRVICYCGSGATACHTLFALALAGISGARLYPGSWSEWIHHH